MQEAATRVRAEQRRRWETGQRVLLEELLAHEPALAESVEDVLDLIYAEVLLREEFGEVTDAAGYAARFPTHADEIAKQFGVHALFQSGSTATPDGSTVRENWAFARPEVPGYDIGRQIGHGAWGVVYEARQLNVGGRRVALKIVRPDRLTDIGRATLRRDGEAAGRLSHPNIARVYDCGECGDGLYVALEFVDGGTLEDRLQAGPLPAAEAARVAAAIAAAVHHAHANGLVHRDLKPSNILLAADGSPKVTDFGLAKRLDGQSSLAPSGAIVGTWQYMAPEQAAGAKDDVGPAADVWAVGVLLHEMLTGRRPFGDPDPVELLRRMQHDAPAAVPRRVAPRDLDAVRRKCLEKRPADRYASAAELGADLGRWLAGEPTLGRLPGWPRRVVRGVRRRPAAVGILALALLTLYAGGVAAHRWWTDPQHAMARALERGDRFELLGSDGRPKLSAWRQSPAELVPHADGSGAMMFSTTATSLLELAGDPGRTAFKFSAELCHLENTRDKEFGIVGIYAGYQSHDEDQGRVDRWYGLEYTDKPLPDPPAGERTTPCRAESIDNAIALNKDGRWADCRLGLDKKRYALPSQAARLAPWRRLTVEVRPDGVSGELSGTELTWNPKFFSAENYAGDSPAVDKQIARTRLSVPPPARAWNPRGSIGIYATRSTVAFRNVVIESVR